MSRLTGLSQHLGTRERFQSRPGCLLLAEKRQQELKHLQRQLDQLLSAEKRRWALEQLQRCPLAADQA